MEYGTEDSAHESFLSSLNGGISLVASVLTTFYGRSKRQGVKIEYNISTY
jgi:hypothetical protein